MTEYEQTLLKDFQDTLEANARIPGFNGTNFVTGDWPRLARVVRGGGEGVGSVIGFYADSGRCNALNELALY